MEESINELREFIYLDDASVNGHLSSLGVGLPKEKQQPSSHQDKSRGRVRAWLPSPFGGVSGDIEGRRLNQNSTETEVDVTAPYRFQYLLKKIEEIGNGIKPPTGDISYGDVVKFTGKAEPMSLFRFELAEEANLSIQEATIKAQTASSKFHQTVKEEMESNIDKHQLEKLGIDLEEIKKQIEESSGPSKELFESQAELHKDLTNISKLMTGDRVSLRVDSKDGRFGLLLDRQQMRTPVAHAFSRPRKYTVLGRVERQIDGDKEWDPLDTTRLLSGFSEEAEEINGFINSIEELASELGLVMGQKHLTLDSPATIIHPIAIYW
jgi:hypothetical protein